MTSARLCSSFDFALPLSATSLASARDLGALHAGCTPAAVAAAACALPWAMVAFSCCAELRRGGVGVRRGRLLVGERALELRLARLRELLLGDVRVGHLLVGLVLARLEVDLLGRRRLRHRARPPGSATAWPGLSGAIGVTGFATALDVSGGAVGRGLDVRGLSPPCPG